MRHELYKSRFSRVLTHSPTISQDRTLYNNTELSSTYTYSDAQIMDWFNPVLSFIAQEGFLNGLIASKIPLIWVKNNLFLGLDAISSPVPLRLKKSDRCNHHPAK